MTGLVAYSWGLRKGGEPNPCNARLAQAVARIMIKERDEVCFVSQWEVWAGLQKILSPRSLERFTPHYVVWEHRTKGAYLDTEEVWAQARDVFKRKGTIRRIISVANPFLHLRRCELLVQRDGFTPVRHEIGHIGFDRQNDQWGVRSPLHMLLYVARVVLTGKHGQ